VPRPVRVALLQLQARDLQDHDRAWGELLRAIDDAAAREPELIVLPEASYPAYFLQSRDAYEAAGVHSDEQVLTTLADRAKRHGVHLAAGLVLRAGDALENAAVLFDPEGREIGRYAKSFLWHFDRRWFRAGGHFPVFDLTLPRAGEARAGILICSDSRLEEIPRAYALEGARLIVDRERHLDRLRRQGGHRGALARLCGAVGGDRSAWPLGRAGAERRGGHRRPRA
jgi:predicted amidohydrolase